ncbi:MAG: hypothetical protein JWM28_2832, partial [Chitinophagaceae bacterium]|nr:hypothetical protein [Chitinophagaceae bacterium]
SRSITYAYKNRSNFGYLNFLFSAGSFNDALKRVQYLKSYRAFREQQVANIVQTQRLIEQRKVMQISRKAQKNETLKSQAKEMSVLEVQKQEKGRVITTLKSKEKDLKKQLTAKKKKDVQLKVSIEAIVRRNIEEARKRAEAEAKAEAKANAAKKVAAPPVTNPANSSNNADNSKDAAAVIEKPVTAAKPKSYLDFSAKDVAVNKSFETSKGKLPWPVDNGFVKIPYGRYVMEGLGVTGVNPGLTIVTPSVGTSVKVIFDGDVAGVYNLGDGMAVTIRHGKYFTTYSNLASVAVAKNQAVQKGQVIGKAAQEEDGNGGQIDFILMVESKNVNPAIWLHK